MRRSTFQSRPLPLVLCFFIFGSISTEDTLFRAELKPFSLLSRTAILKKVEKYANAAGGRLNQSDT